MMLVLVSNSAPGYGIIIFIALENSHIQREKQNITILTYPTNQIQNRAPFPYAPLFDSHAKKNATDVKFQKSEVLVKEIHELNR